MIPDRFLYDRADLEALAQMWQHVIEAESGYASVVTGQAPRPVLAFGISVFVKTDFYRSMLADPQPFAASRILQAWKRGEDSPLMSRAEVAEANAGWGVDVFVLHHGYAPKSDDAEYYEVVMALAAEFVRTHAGLNLRSLTQEFYDRAWLDVSSRHGFSVRHDFGRTILAGVHRSEVLAPDRGDFVTNALFARFPAPRLRLDAAQRRLLRALLEEESETAADSDDRLDGIHDRIARIDAPPAALSGAAQRRRHALSWLRSHPEELHPYAMPDAMPSE